MTRAGSVFALLLALAVLSGCDGMGAPAGKTESQPPAANQKSDVDQLRAMPYAGFSESADARSGVTIRDAERMQPGYSLYSVHKLCRADLIDETGRLVHTWHYPDSRNWDHVTLLPDGDLLLVGADGEDRPGQGVADELRYAMRLDWHSRVRWKRALTAHHDIELTPGGELLTLTFHRRPIRAVHPQIETRDDRLTLLTIEGNPSEHRSLYDMIAAKPDVFPLQTVGPERKGGKAWIDLFHCNSIDWMHQPELAQRDPLYGLRNVLVCFRHQDRIAVFDWDQSTLVWAWGQGELDGPHDAQVLPSGNILVFDNGLARGWSRVIEIEPLTRKIVWEYRAPQPKDFYTASKGSNQRLANGNTLITNSDNGHVFEVTRDGQVVWEFYVPHRNSRGQRAALVRCYRYDRAPLDALIQRAAASQPAGGG